MQNELREERERETAWRMVRPCCTISPIHQHPTAFFGGKKSLPSLGQSWARPSRIVGQGYSQTGTFWCVMCVTNTGPQPTSSGAKNVMWRRRGPNRPPLVQKTLRDEHGASTDLLWCKKWQLSNSLTTAFSQFGEDVEKYWVKALIYSSSIVLVRLLAH